MRASTDVTSTGGKAVSGKEHQKKEYRQWGGRTRALWGREALRSVICVTMAETCKYAEAHPQTLTRTEDLSTSGAAQVYRDCFIWTVLKFCHMCSLIWSCSQTDMNGQVWSGWVSSRFCRGNIRCPSGSFPPTAPDNPDAGAPGSPRRCNPPHPGQARPER